mgnify:CR=1 FL=1
MYLTKLPLLKLTIRGLSKFSHLIASNGFKLLGVVPVKIVSEEALSLNLE